MEPKTSSKMASSTGAKRKGNFKLDTDDMERRLVEFRVSLDREKRRCQAAMMTDKYEKLLTDKLVEIGSQLTAGAAGAGEPTQAAGTQDNGFRYINEESVGRLRNLLDTVLTQSVRVEQLDLISGVMHAFLLDARVKRIRAADQMPPGSVRHIDPMCGFCYHITKDKDGQPLRQEPGGSGNGMCVNCRCQLAGLGSAIVEPVVPTMDELRPSFSQYQHLDPNISNTTSSQYQEQQQQQQQQETPPASNPTTPEVGEQASGFTYTPNFGNGLGGHQPERQFIVLQRPVSVQAQRPATQPEQQQQQQRLNQPQPQTQQPQQHLNNINNANASSSSSRFVMPSDESSSDSDTNSVRNVLDKLAHTPSGYHEHRQLSSTPVREREKDRKKVAPVAEEDDERPSKLVIDEQQQGPGLEQFFTDDALKTSFLSKSIKTNGPRSKKRPKRPAAYSQQY